MIRVVYRWNVKEVDFANFQKMWSRTTNHIHEAVAGVLGSFMLRSSEDPTELLTVAKWDSVESWKAFWVVDNTSEMKGMREIGEQISVTVYDEVGDYARSHEEWRDGIVLCATQPVAFIGRIYDSVSVRRKAKAL